MEIKSLFDENNQSVLSAFGHVILMPDSPEDSADEHYERLTAHYGVDQDLLKAEKAIFSNFIQEKHTHQSDTANYSVLWELSTRMIFIACCMFSRTASILATIPAMSCSAEHSFSALRCLKTYLSKVVRHV